MGRNGTGDWTTPATNYTAEHVEHVLNLIGVEISQETATNFLCFCPFHENVHTPSFSVDKVTGRYICFNHACNVHGGFRSLIGRLTKKTQPEVIRFILQSKRGGDLPYAERRARQMRDSEWPCMPMELLERMEQDLWSNEAAQDYLMNTRGFTEKTLRHFRVGYSAPQNMVFTPMFDVTGAPLGGIGRSIVGKDFRNTPKLPRGRTLWNIHNAKKSNTAYVVEANFDGMSVHQAGFPGVVAVLGGHFSEEHADQLDRHFEKVVLMTDDDEPQVYENCRKCIDSGSDTCQGHNPGRELGEGIAAKMQKRGKPVFWAMYSDDMIYPAKDANAMTAEQIRQCLTNPVSTFRYHRLMESVV